MKLKPLSKCYNSAYLFTWVVCKLDIIEALKKIEDPRQQGKINYSLVNILFISICAIFNSAETWEDIVMYAKYRENWLSKYIDMSTGIPSSYTFRRVFGLISPD